MKLKDVAIIGAGPCGIAAAIYLKRAGFDIAIFEGNEIGGLLHNANLVENYPGFWEGISGGDLVVLFEKQLVRLKINVNLQEVLDLRTDPSGFIIMTNKDEITSKAVIIASGTVPRDIGLSGQSQFIGKKLFYEIKDIPSLLGEETLVIIGSGDAAFDYALNASKGAKRVDILMRSVHPRCLPLLEERVKLRDNIFINPDTQPQVISEEEGKILMICAQKEKEVTFSSDYGLIACGRDPNLCFISKEMQDHLEFKVKGDTNIPGLFIGGDVNSGHFRQVGIAVGEGILCAMKAQEFLKEENKK
jgi:thioredoxin reductase (NADPH)